MIIEKILSAVNSAVSSTDGAQSNKRGYGGRTRSTVHADENEQVSFVPQSSSDNKGSNFFTEMFNLINNLINSIFGNNKSEDNKTDDTQRSANSHDDFDASFDDMLGYVFDFEGGFANIPEDRGGATNYGITQDTYNYWNEKNGLPEKDVQYITKEEAKEIYYNEFYVASGAKEYADNGNKAYAFALFDAAVNHGVGAAYDFDEEAKGDVDKFMAIRKQFYIDIVANDPSQEIFEYGWQNRWNKVYSIIDKNHEYEDYIS